MIFLCCVSVVLSLFFFIILFIKSTYTVEGCPKNTAARRVMLLMIFPLLAGRSATTLHRLASECHSGAVQSISLYQLLRVMKVRIELYITSSHTPTEQLLQLKRRTTQYCGARRGKRGGKEGRAGSRGRPHTASFSVHRVAEATLKSMPPAPACINRLIADKGDRTGVSLGERLISFSSSLAFLQDTTPKKQYFERIMTKMNASTFVTILFPAEPTVVRD